MAAPTFSAFRKAFPEFSDGERYPESVVTFWLEFGAQMVNASRWKTLTDTGVFLFAAHNIAIERKAMDEADRGGTPGGMSGPVSSKSVDKVSVSYDSAAAIEPGAGHWNLTIYGTRFARFSRMFGMGGLQIGPSRGAGCGGAWAGPWTSNFPNPSG